MKKARFDETSEKITQWYRGKKSPRLESTGM